MISGNPVGMAPITGTSFNHSTLSAVPAMRATRVPGRRLENLLGQRTPMARVRSAIVKAL